MHVDKLQNFWEYNWKKTNKPICVCRFVFPVPCFIFLKALLESVQPVSVVLAHLCGLAEGDVVVWNGLHGGIVVLKEGIPEEPQVQYSTSPGLIWKPSNDAQYYFIILYMKNLRADFMFVVTSDCNMTTSTNLMRTFSCNLVTAVLKLTRTDVQTNVQLKSFLKKWKYFNNRVCTSRIVWLSCSHMSTLIQIVNLIEIIFHACRKREQKHWVLTRKWQWEWVSLCWLNVSNK